MHHSLRILCVSASNLDLSGMVDSSNNTNYYTEMYLQGVYSQNDNC